MTRNKRNFGDSGFVMDNNFNVLDGDKGFQQFFNVDVPHINLCDYLDEADIKNFSSFLENYTETNSTPYFIAAVTVDKIQHFCVFYLINAFNNQFTLRLKNVSSLLGSHKETQFNSSMMSSALSGVESFYFIFDGEKIRLNSLKDGTTLFDDIFTKFREFFISNFKINTEQKDAYMQLEYFIAQTSFMQANKGYKLLVQDGSFISIRTAESRINNQRILMGLMTNGVDLISENNEFTEIKDGLTGLYNKKTITEKAVQKFNRNKSEAALIIIDLDKFKECNDTYGHAFGDKVLVAVSNVIQEAVEGVGIAGRIGGDEFMAIIDKTEEEDIRNVTRNIRLGIQWSIPAIEPDSIVTCSMGIARCPKNAQTYEELFAIADKCLYVAKNKGRNCYVIYKPEIHDQMFEKQEKNNNDMLSGHTFMDGAITQTAIATLLYPLKKENIPLAMDELIKYMGLSKMTVYSPEGKVLYIRGADEVDVRAGKITATYSRFFNDCGFMHLDNTSVFSTIDRDRYEIYLSANIASTIEIMCKDENGKDQALICFDIYKPARSFDKEKIVFAIAMAKIIASMV